MHRLLRRSSARTKLAGYNPLSGPAGNRGAFLFGGKLIALQWVRRVHEIDHRALRLCAQDLAISDPYGSERLLEPAAERVSEVVCNSRHALMHPLT
jgi:hypothetical protein